MAETFVQLLIKTEEKNMHLPKLVDINKSNLLVVKRDLILKVAPPITKYADWILDQ